MHLRPNRKKDKKQEDIANITWDVRGKVRTIERAQNAQASELEFLYDAMGQRVMKIERKPQSGNTREEVYTVYVRDAQGNVMAVYKGDRTIQGNPLVNLTTTEYRLEEHHLYGSSRLGMERYVDDTLYYGQTFSLLGNSTTTVTPVTPNNDFAETQVVGAKNLEMSNHLGNVLVVVSDMKRSVEGNPGQTSHYTADVISWSDYMPFGSQMEGRNGSAGNYRYGMNGMEKDDEVSGTGNSYSTEYRQYDPRLGRWMAVDPIYKDHESPYAAYSNNPITTIDPLGTDTIWVTSDKLDSEGRSPGDPGYSDENEKLILFTAYSNDDFKGTMGYTEFNENYQTVAEDYVFEANGWDLTIDFARVLSVNTSNKYFSLAVSTTTLGDLNALLNDAKEEIGSHFSLWEKIWLFDHGNRFDIKSKFGKLVFIEDVGIFNSDFLGNVFWGAISAHGSSVAEALHDGDQFQTSLKVKGMKLSGGIDDPLDSYAIVIGAYFGKYGFAQSTFTTKMPFEKHVEEQRHPDTQDYLFKINSIYYVIGGDIYR